MPISRTPLVAAVLIALGSAACSKDEPPAPAPMPAKAAASAAPASTGAGAAPAAPVPALAEAPKSLGAMRVPADNPLTAEKVALGHQLFFDKRLSGDGSMACYSCHLNEDGTGGHDAIGTGPKGVKLTRHSPTLWNVGYLPKLYWDGRADNLEAQVKGAITGPNMGVGAEGLEAKVKEIYGVAGYKAAFDRIFPMEGASPVTVSQVVASYLRTVTCGDTAYDKFSGGDASALTEDQKKGWALFSGKAGCHNCHTPPFFSDAFLAEGGAYHNNGISMKGKKKEEIDPGRMKVTNAAADFGTFKTPSLRNISKSAPYFHDGSVAKLEDAVTFMATGGFKNENLDPKLEDKKLTKDEIGSLVSFLGALDCPGKLEEPKLP